MRISLLFASLAMGFCLPTLSQVIDSIPTPTLLKDSVITVNINTISEPRTVEISDTNAQAETLAAEIIPEEGPDTAMILQQQIRRAQLNAEGDEFMSHSEWSPAARRFREALAIDSGFLIARQNLGLALLELGEWDEASRQFSIFLRDSVSPMAYFGRARAMLSLDREAEALSDLESTLQLDPNHADAWYEKGVISFLRASFMEALEAFEHATAINPYHAYAWNDKGSAFRANGNFEEALKCYQEAVLIAPGNYIIHGNLGSLQKEMKHYPAALASFTEAIRLNPLDGRIWNQRGVLMNEMGDYDRAEEDLSKAIQVQSGMAIAWNNRGNTRFKMKQFKEAIADYNEALRLDPSYGFAYLNRGIAREMIRDEEGACSDWLKAASLGVKSANIYIENQCKNILKEAK